MAPRDSSARSLCPGRGSGRRPVFRCPPSCCAKRGAAACLGSRWRPSGPNGRLAPPRACARLPGGASLPCGCSDGLHCLGLGLLHLALPPETARGRPVAGRTTRNFFLPNPAPRLPPISRALLTSLRLPRGIDLSSLGGRLARHCLGRSCFALLPFSASSAVQFATS